MKFSIVLVEDEPTALRHLRSVIEKKCPSYEIIGVAENGIDGFKLVEKMKPDLLISDIRMPGMDGMELIGKVKNDFPGIFSIIVSGYQEFEYAKEAIRSEVIDYILKPISIPDIVKLLDRIYEKLSRREYKIILETLVQSLSVRDSFTFRTTKNFTMALIRRNGPHPHFSGFSGNNPPDPINNILQSIISEKEQKQLWLLQGQDENEWCILGDADSLHYSRFREIITIFGRKLPCCHYYTAILSITARGRNLFSRLMNLYRILQGNLTLGKSQILYDDSPIPKVVLENHSLESSFYKKLDYFCTNEVFESLNAELSTSFRLWQKNQLPAQQILIELRQVTTRMLQYCPDKRELQPGIESELDSVVMRCRDFEDLGVQFKKIVTEVQSHLKCRTIKTGSQESLERITEYISSHIAEELMIPFLSHKFCISQSYLNRIFHKYTGKSVVEYISDTRIEKSLDIMRESPFILLKDISVMVGYEDASYFSKVFKAKKGVSPQHFRATFMIQ